MFVVWGFVFLSVASIDAAPLNTSQVRELSLRDAIRYALANNRLLQIERFNPVIARMTLRSSYGYYDPIFLSQAQRETQTDPGGFDPADPSADAVFTAESDVLAASLTGVLPTGLRYNVGGDYAHSSGSRDFLTFESYKLDASVYLQQPLLRNFWIDQGRYTIRLNKGNLKISEHGVRFVAMNIINMARQAYYDLIFAWDSLFLQEDLLHTRETFLRGVQRQIEVGTYTVLEEKLARSQHATVKTALIAASNAVALAANNLKSLMGFTATNWSVGPLVPSDSMVVVPQELDLVSSWQRGLMFRPDLAQITQLAENANLAVKYRRNQLFPSLDLIGSYGRRGASSMQTFPPDEPIASFPDAFDQVKRGDTPSDMLGIILTFPLSRTTERAEYRASKLLKAQAGVRVKELEERIMREVSDALENARSAYQRLEASRQAALYAEEALKAEEEKLRSGKTSIFFVLQLQSSLTAARTAELQSKLDYNKALSQLRFAEGTILDHEKIEIEIR